MRSRYLLQILSICGLLLASFLVQAAVNFHANSQIVFASSEDAKALLAKPDQYLSRLSQFDMESRLNRHGHVSTDEFVQRAASEVLAWDQQEVKRLQKITRRLSRKLKHYDFPLPEEIVLIKVQGLMEAGAAYTRHNAIVLPTNYLISKTDQQMEFLIAHELFHILSRYNASLRAESYAVIGFKPCNDVTLPGKLAELKISNPDAPYYDFYIEVIVKGKNVKVIPVIYSAEVFNPKQQRNFFEYLKLGFLQIENINGQYLALEKNNVPVIYRLDEIEGFFEKIGRNTRYIIHPEEIMADNFAMLIMKVEPIATPDIHIKLKTLIQN